MGDQVTAIDQSTGAEMNFIGKRMQGARPVALVLLLVGSTLALPALSPPALAAPGTDFNGDGFADLAVGAPREGVGTTLLAGAVNVLYGSSTGLTATGNQLWTQDSPGILGAAEKGDGFGSAIAGGDFNGDGFADLAVGVPLEDVATRTTITPNVGAVNVLYGSPTGLTAAGDQFWTQDSAGILSVAEEYDRFGFSLAAANFGRSSHADLAVGVPHQDVGPDSGAGAVSVLYGSKGGLTDAGNQLWTQDSTDVVELADEDDEFGFSLAAADFGKSSHADLAVGVPREEVDTATNAGAVSVLYGSPTGLNAIGDQLLTRDPEHSDQFGSSLAAADFGKSSQADLAVGAPNREVTETISAGAVSVLYGSSTGLTEDGGQDWSQDDAGVFDAASSGDHFGSSLAAANFGKSSQADLAVGIPDEDAADTQYGGAVNVLYGSPTGLTAAGDELWTQDSTGIQDSAESGDHFGSSLAAANFGKSSQADLAVGVPYEDAGDTQHGGAVHVLHGSSTGLTATGNQLWTQDSKEIVDTAESGDQFGSSLAAAK